MTLSDPNPGYKVTGYLKVEYLAVATDPKWYHVCWPRLTPKRVAQVVSMRWASCYLRDTAKCLAGWLAGWLGVCLSQPVLFQTD